MNSFRDGLLKVVRNKKDSCNIELKSHDDETFLNTYHRLKNDNAHKTGGSLEVIPTFYKENTNEDDSILSMLDIEVRTLFLHNKNNSLLDTDELETLKDLLEKHSSQDATGEKSITYADLKKVTTSAGEKYSGYFSAKVFAEIQNGDEINNVGIDPLFTYAMRKTWLYKTRVGLSIYDGKGKGFLRECELESFISDLIPDCPQLRSLKKTFYPFYVCNAVRKFLFFLDPMKMGLIKIKDILTSNILDDLLVLRNEDLPDDLLNTNWFSSTTALRVYGQYLTLDKDSNGMLSKKELLELGTGTITDVFVDRVFQEYQTYGGEMDYKAYLDLILAMENKHEPQALRYFFKIFDINGKGYLDAFCLNFFFRGVQKEMKKHQQDPVSFEDIKDELFDMVRPVDPFKITLQDLLRCEQAEYFVNILTDLNEFWNYENIECY